MANPELSYSIHVSNANRYHSIFTGTTTTINSHYHAFQRLLQRLNADASPVSTHNIDCETLQLSTRPFIKLSSAKIVPTFLPREGAMRRSGARLVSCLQRSEWDVSFCVRGVWVGANGESFRWVSQSSFDRRWFLSSGHAVRFVIAAVITFVCMHEWGKKRVLKMWPSQAVKCESIDLGFRTCFPHPFPAQSRQAVLTLLESFPFQGIQTDGRTAYFMRVPW